MLLWSYLTDLPQKPRVNTLYPTRNVVCTENGWEYYNGNYQLLISNNCLFQGLGSNRIYKIYFSKENDSPNFYSSADLIIEFLKPLVINNSNASVTVYINDLNNTRAFYFSDTKSIPEGGTLVFTSQNFEFFSSDSVFILEDSLNNFQYSILPTTNDTITFTLPEEGVSLWGDIPNLSNPPDPPNPPSS